MFRHPIADARIEKQVAASQHAVPDAYLAGSINIFAILRGRFIGLESAP
jgi:hypothetical protein